MARSHRHAVWTWSIRGGCALAFGLGTLAYVTPRVETVLPLFAAFTVLDGVWALIATTAVRRDTQVRTLALLEAVTGLGIAILALALPTATLGLTLALMVAWALVVGALELAAAAHLRRGVAGDWTAGVSGSLTLLFGATLVVIQPQGFPVLAWVFGAYAVLAGCLMLMLGHWLRRQPGVLHGRPEVP